MNDMCNDDALICIQLLINKLRTKFIPDQKQTQKQKQKLRNIVGLHG